MMEMLHVQPDQAARCLCSFRFSVAEPVPQAMTRHLCRWTAYAYMYVCLVRTAAEIRRYHEKGSLSLSKEITMTEQYIRTSSHSCFLPTTKKSMLTHSLDPPTSQCEYYGPQNIRRLAGCAESPSLQVARQY